MAYTDTQTLFGFADNFESSEERAAADRAQLFQTHKARGSLGTYYGIYPQDMPAPMRQPEWERRRDQERER